MYYYAAAHVRIVARDRQRSLKTNPKLMGHGAEERRQCSGAAARIGPGELPDGLGLAA